MKAAQADRSGWWAEDYSLAIDNAYAMANWCECKHQRTQEAARGKDHWITQKKAYIAIAAELRVGRKENHRG